MSVPTGPRCLPIAGDEIRLLRLLPEAAGKDPYIEVEVYNRLHAPSYTAVSYVWGVESADPVIFMNGRPVAVRPNLWHCLQQMQRHHLWEYYWIDALCINQDDIDERSVQVRQMDETYSQAACVAAWLGPGDRHTAMFFEDAENRFPSGRFNPTDAECEALKQLSGRPYWCRMWIVQELLLARRVEVFCGKYHMDWNSFKSAFTNLLEMAYSRVDGYVLRLHPVMRYIGPEGVSRLAAGDRNSLLCLLIDYGKCACWDPRDKVFGLLGLLQKPERESLHKNFANYRLSLGQVITSTLAHILAQESSSVVLFPRVLEAFDVDDQSARILRQVMDPLSTPTDLRAWVEAKKTAEQVASRRLLDGTLTMGDIFDVFGYRKPMVAIRDRYGTRACLDPRVRRPQAQIVPHGGQLFELRGGSPRDATGLVLGPDRWFTTVIDPDRASHRRGQKRV